MAFMGKAILGTDTFANPLCNPANLLFSQFINSSFQFIAWKSNLATIAL